MRNCTIRVVKNKGDDQLCSYCTADLRLCFSHMQNVCFLITQPIFIHAEMEPLLEIGSHQGT